MDQEAQETILTKLTKSEHPAVVVSGDATFDDLAAGLALYLSLKNLGKNASIFANTPTVDDARKLYGVGQIGNAQNRKNLVIKVQNAVKSVDKVTYFLDKENRLNITVHALAGGPGISSEDVSYESSSVLADVIFAINFKSKMELEQIITPEQFNDPNVLTISLTRKVMDQKIAQINILDESSGSTSEMVTATVQRLALPVNEDVAYNLFSGISFATDNFSPSRSTPRSFEAAGWLIKFGAGKSSMATSYRDSFNFDRVPALPPQRPIRQTDQTQNAMVSQSASNFTQNQLTTQEDILPQEQSPKQDFPKKPSELKKDWLRPPKIYKGAKSFDTES